MGREFRPVTGKGFIPNPSVKYVVGDGKIITISGIALREESGEQPIEPNTTARALYSGAINRARDIGDVNVSSYGSTETYENLKPASKFVGAILSEKINPTQSKPKGKIVEPPPLTEAEKNDQEISAHYRDFSDFKAEGDRDGMRRTSEFLQTARAELFGGLMQFSEPPPLDDDEKADEWVSYLYRQFCQEEDTSERVRRAKQLEKERAELQRDLYGPIEELTPEMQKIIPTQEDSTLNYPDWIPKAKNHNLTIMLSSFDLLADAHKTYLFNRKQVAEHLSSGPPNHVSVLVFDELVEELDALWS